MLTGKGGVIRGGAGIVYDRFGSNLVTQFDSSASFGLSEIVRRRLAQLHHRPALLGTLPAIGAAPLHSFPYAPPTIDSMRAATWAFASDLHTPYPYNANLSVARQLPGHDRGSRLRRPLGRDLLMQIRRRRLGVLLRIRRAARAGRRWRRRFARYKDRRRRSNRHPHNPARGGRIPFIESMMPALANLYFPAAPPRTTST
jgi:hypothetical protein